MSREERIYIPQRTAWQGIIAGNSLAQLEHTGKTESVYVGEYDKRGVKGWMVQRANEDRILVVNKRTSASPFQAVLYIPGITGVPTSDEDMTDGWQWLQPKTTKLDDADEMGRRSTCARESWSNRFAFLKEVYDDRDILVTPGLRTPQMGALHAALAHWSVTQEVGTVVMPTGTGKTEVMLALLTKERPESLLIIVPTDALRDQIADKFLTLGVLQQCGVVRKGAMLPVVGKVKRRFHSADDVGRFFKCCNVAVATMAVIGKCSDVMQVAIAKACTHLFIDEAHHAPAPTWDSFRKHVRAEQKPVLQFTATPFRRDGKLVGGVSIFTYPLKKAQDERFFTRITFISIWEYRLDHGDEAIATRAIQALKNDLNHGRDHLLMARTNTIDRANQVHRIYERLTPEFSPLIVHSKQKKAVRAAAIKAIRGRHSRIIVCVDMLGEGFDLPQLKIAALHDIHKSLAVTLQFVGRFTRTATGLGDATVIANAADADVEEALEDLYSKDSDWDDVLQKLSEGETVKQRQRSDFIEGFQNVSPGIPLENIYPKMSTVVYKTKCKNWRYAALRRHLKNTDFLLEPDVNHTKRVLLYITREPFPVAWGKTQSVQNLLYELYLYHWDECQNLLFINSTNNRSTHYVLAKTLAGEDVELIRGEQVYRSLHNIERLILTNLGMIDQFSRAVRFTMRVGSDIKNGLVPASVGSRRKTNLFGRGYEHGESTSIGASFKGRIWSQRVAEDILEWVKWCQNVGKKLSDDSISTDKIIEQSIVPEPITERPNLIPLAIEWPPNLLKRNEEAVSVEIGEVTCPFYEVDLKITTFRDSGPLRFHVAIDDETKVEYEVKFSGNQVNYVPTSDAIVHLSISGTRLTLTEWFQEHSPLITFEDTSQLVYNQLATPKSERKPFDASTIEGWTWDGVEQRKESQYSAIDNAQRLELRRDSIQYHVIEYLKAADTNYDIIFDDDGTREIADIVALKVADDDLLVHLFHCKYSSRNKPGVRVQDVYEVCGQAQKSVDWKYKERDLFGRLKLREQKRMQVFGITRFAMGNLQRLDEVRRQFRNLDSKFHIYIVQPGLNAQEVDGHILDILGATELYVKVTINAPLTIIGSGKGTMQGGSDSD